MPPVGRAQRPGLEDRGRGDVHVGVGLLEQEERVVERGQAIVGVARQRLPGSKASTYVAGHVHDPVEEAHGERVHEDVAQLPERRVPLLARQRSVEDLGDRLAGAAGERVEDLLADLAPTRRPARPSRSPRRRNGCRP